MLGTRNSLLICRNVGRPNKYIISVFKDRSDTRLNVRPETRYSQSSLKTAHFALCPIVKGETKILPRTAKLSIPF